jgi:triacylglycerol lipase
VRTFVLLGPLRLWYWLLVVAAPAANASEGVILLHGLARSAASMRTLEHALTRAGYVVVNFEYPSRTARVEDLAPRTIAAALKDPRLADCQRIHFVTHSMGGILVRHYTSKQSIPKLGRIVMLGPPNHGSEVVDHLKGWRLFKWINGPAGRELGTDCDSAPNRLGPVVFELGVIAGDRSINWINSLMIPGPNDGKVSVESTKVAGMKEHLVLHTTHPMMMKNRRVISATLRFLATGSFVERLTKNRASTSGAP